MHNSTLFVHIFVLFHLVAFHPILLHSIRMHWWQRPRTEVSAKIHSRRCVIHSRWRPYRVECTGSLSTSEVKRRRARLVLGWGTAWEDLRVLSAFAHCSSDSWTLRQLQWERLQPYDHDIISACELSTVSASANFNNAASYPTAQRKGKSKGTRGKGEKLTKDTQAYYIPRIMPSIKSPNQGRNLPEWCFFPS